MTIGLSTNGGMTGNVPFSQIISKDQGPIIYSTQDVSENQYGYPQNNNGNSISTEMANMPNAK